jgi:hypothetical protein
MDTNKKTMNDKQNYTAPAVLDDLALALEAEILGASTAQVDENIKEVDTMGQDVGGTINENNWNSSWEQ